MSRSRNARRTRLGIPDEGPPTNEVSDMTSVCSDTTSVRSDTTSVRSDTTSVRSEQDVRRDEEMRSSSPTGTAKGHPIADDQGAATAVGSSSGKSTAQEQS